MLKKLDKCIVINNFNYNINSQRIVDRSKILNQAEILFKDMAGDKSLLEIQYINEVIFKYILYQIQYI